MATVVNARDVLLQAATIRVNPVGLPVNVVVQPEDVVGLPEYYTSAKEVTLRATSLVFQTPKVGATTPTAITLTAIPRNITGTPTFSVVSGTATFTVEGAVATILPAGLTSQTATIQVSYLADGVTYTDRVTIANIAEGSDAVTGLLSNESVTVVASSVGVVSTTEFQSAGGTFHVFDGIINKTGLPAIVYSVASESGVDVSIASTGVYTVNSMSANSGTATLRAVYTNGNGDSVTIDKVYTIAKAIAGAAGQDGQDGTNGTDGERGNVNISKAVTGVAWADVDAVAAISEQGFGVPQNRDIVTLYNTTDPETPWSTTKFYDGSTTSWLSLDAYINGNLLVEGTVLADALKVDSLSAISADLGTVTTGTLTAGTIFSGDLQAANGTFSGELKGATGEFSGILLAGTVDLTKMAGQSTIYAASATPYTLTVPADFTSMRVTLIGGGGGGGRGYSASNSGGGGGGGGAGGISIATFNDLTPGTEYTLYVGLGGAQEVNGGNTSITGLITAYGGQAGDRGASGPGGAGGAGGAGTTLNGSSGGAGPHMYSGVGGTGGAPNGGLGGAQGEGGGDYSGGGGGGAGTQYGTGGAGGQYPSPRRIGQPGSGKGAGGGGGRGLHDSNGSYTYAGAGAHGQATIEFFNPNGVVIRSEYTTLINALERQGIATV